MLLTQLRYGVDNIKTNRPIATVSNGPYVAAEREVSQQTI